MSNLIERAKIFHTYMNFAADLGNKLQITEWPGPVNVKEKKQIGKIERLIIHIYVTLKPVTVSSKCII